MRNYRDLRVWDEAHRLTLAIYQVTASFPKEERFGLTSQIRRASASIAANLAEGCGRRSDGEMGRFVQIAMGSGSELSYRLMLSRVLKFLPQEEYANLNPRLERVMKMLSALASKMKKGERSLVSSQKLRANSYGPGTRSFLPVTCPFPPIRASVETKDA